VPPPPATLIDREKTSMKKWTTSPMILMDSMVGRRNLQRLSPPPLRRWYPTTSRGSSSSGAFGPSRPLNMKIILTGEPTNGDSTSRSNRRWLKQMLPVGRTVHKGDIIALVGGPPPHHDGDDTGNDTVDTDSGNDYGDVAIASPETGRITSWYAELATPIATGDALMELLVEDIHEDHFAWKEQLEQHQGHVTDEFLHTYLQLDDVFRLQQIVKHILEEWWTLFPPAVLSLLLSSSLYPRIAELQHNSGVEEAQTRTDWGVLLFNMGDRTGALTQLHHSLQLRQAAFGSEKAHPLIAASHIHLGAVYKQMGDLEQSLEHMSQALELQIKHVGSDQHAMIASGYNNVGTIHFQMGHALEAKEQYAKALEIQQFLSHNGQDTAETAGTYHNLGLALKQLGQTDEALHHLTKALQLRLQRQQKEEGDAAAGGDKNINADVAASHFAMGQIMAEMRQMDEALVHFQSAVTIQEHLYGKESPITAAGYTNVGAVYNQRQEYDAALDWYRRALSILQTATPGHQDVAAAFNNVGMALYQLGEFEQSLNHHNQGRRILEEAYGRDHPILATTLGSIGNVLRSLQRFDDAMVEYQTAHSLLVQALGPLHFEVASSLNNIGMMFSLLHQSDRALESYQSAARIFAQTLGPQHPHTASCYFNVGLVYKSMGNLTNALDAFRQAKDIWLESLGPNHPNTVMAVHTIQECHP
jgi:tetratricopeptide (TPR) repeat protein